MNILFIGHSLIEFFDWQERFPSHSVANLGVAGETVEGLLSRLETIIKDHHMPDRIFLMTGLNNIAMDDFGFFGSYKKILERLQEAYPDARIFINSILPTLLEFIPDESIINANKFLEDLARQKKVEFLNIYRLFIDREGKPVKYYFLEDGVHLSNMGYAVWSKELEAIINQTA